MAGKMSLGEIGRFVAGRTGNMEAAKIARSSMPQVRYDAVIYHLICDPQQLAQFSHAEAVELVERISDGVRRNRACEIVQS